MPAPPRFVLASASPRRAELLRASGFDFEVIVGDTDEAVRPGERADAYVRRVAEAKADTVRARAHGLPVLAADTVVVVDADILGKPRDHAEARLMLSRLSGRTHLVMTGVTLRADTSHTEVDVTQVAFAVLSTAEMDWYIASGEPMDKAGAYGIQGLASRFVTRIEGSYSNVVGLPVARVYRLLHRLENDRRPS